MLTLIAAGISIQQVTQKSYNLRVTGRAYSFTAASALISAFIFFIASGGTLEFSAEMIVYSALFAIAHCTATVSSFLAIRTGSLSLTSLIVQYSLIIPTFCGFIMFDEPLKPTLFIGIAILLVSLIFINFEGKQEKKITLKWCVFVLLAFAGNGALSVIQKVQQIKFDGLYKSEFMIVALLITVVILIVFALFSEKNQITYNLKSGALWYTICGLANGAVNFLVLVMSNKMPASVMFPIISAGGIIITALVSIFVYKEKLSVLQKISMLLGIISIIILNL